MSLASVCLSFRVYHTVLTLFIAGSLLWCDTSIRNALQKRDNASDLLKSLLYFILLTASVVLYHVICVIDPGYVTPNMISECGGIDALEDNGTTSAKPVKLRKCGFCDLVQPLRARHCEVCGRCVRRFDHHCPWFETCIGERNHKYFLSFLILKACIIVWTIRVVFASFQSTPDWSKWWHYNCILVIDAVVLLPSVFSVICLIVIHTYAAVINQTTWEMVSRMRISYLKDLDIEDNPFHRGYLKNMYYFLCNRNVRRWELWYNRREIHDI